MADLSSMFQNLGPTGGALMTGLTTGQDLVSSMRQDEMRNAQMQEILQNIEQRKLTNPLDVQAKQQAVDAANLKAKQDKQEYYNKVVGDLIPELERIPGPARHAYMAQRLQNAGLPMDEVDSAWAQQHTGDELINKLKRAHEWHVTQAADYRKSMDVAREHSRSAENVANINAKSRADIAAQKAAKTAATVEQQAAAGKLSYEKAAVAFSIMAMNADTLEDQQKLQQKAAQYEQLAAKLKAAGNAGKVDVGAATNLPTTGYEPVLGGGATPPANTNSPKLPAGWTIK